MYFLELNVYIQNIIEYILNNNFFIFIGLSIGFTVGILTGLFGAGGGFLITPALNIFLGIPMNLAVGTSSAQVLGASFFSLSQKFDRKRTEFKLILPIALGIPLGSFGGTLVVKNLHAISPFLINGHKIIAADLYLLSFFAIFLLVIAVFMLIDNFVLKRKKNVHYGLLSNIKIPPMMHFHTVSGGEFSGLLLCFIGLLLGFLSGLLGIGGGVIMFPCLYYLVGQETLAVTKSDLVLIFISGIFSTYFHSQNQNIDYILAMILIFGAFAGTRIGLYLQTKMSPILIRRNFAFIVLAAWLLVIWKLRDMILK